MPMRVWAARLAPHGSERARPVGRVRAVNAPPRKGQGMSNESEPLPRRVLVQLIVVEFHEGGQAEEKDIVRKIREYCAAYETTVASRIA